MPDVFEVRSRLFITCSRGVEDFLEREAAELGFPIVAVTRAGIETEGSMRDAMELNMHLRTGLRVLFLVAEFKAAGPDSMYRGINSVSWEDIISPDSYFSITSSVDNPTISDSRFANQKCKDAIADRFMKRIGRRPDSGPERDRAVFHLHWQGDDCRIYADTSGEPLSKRGYRKIPYRAPLQETLAAAIVSASGWHDDGPFVNPMCGSGTLAIEAALTGLNRPAAILRTNFGFMHLKGYDKKIWDDIRQGSRAGAMKTLKNRIIATDINSEAVNAARNNARTAGVEHLIEFRRCDFTDTEIPEGRGVVVMNPEYGERLGHEAELAVTYRNIGDFLKQRCKGYRGYILTGNPGLSKKIGLRTSRKLPFFNGPIECRLLEYELYGGSRKKENGAG